MKRTPKAKASGAGRARGRPALTAGQVADMRAHVASRALELFRAEGYASVSMRRLASEAGCTPMTLYQYFENKFDILRMLWADVLGDLFDRLDEVGADEPDPAARLGALAEGYVEYWLEHREDYFLVFMSGGVSQDDVSLFMGDAALLARFDVFRSCIAEALGARARPEDVRVKSEVFVCGLNGIAQGLVTLSGYPWAGPRPLVRELTARILGR
jgi:AcrR family transcriptional regulator